MLSAFNSPQGSISCVYECHLIAVEFVPFLITVNKSLIRRSLREEEFTLGHGSKVKSTIEGKA